MAQFPEQYIIFVILAPISILVTVGVVLYASRYRRMWETSALIWLMATASGWVIFNTAELIASTPSQTLFWSKICYVFIAATPVAWLLFALRYSGQQRAQQPWYILLYWAIPAITSILALTSSFHTLLWRDYHFTPANGMLALNVSYGPWFWVHIAYSYVLILGSAALMIRQYFKSFKLYRQQSLWLVIGALIPIAVNLIYVARLIPQLRKDFTPISFVLAGFAFAIGMFRYRLFDLKPIACDIVLDRMPDAVLTIDSLGRIVDLNPAAQWLADRTPGPIIGRPLVDLIPAWDDWTQALQERDDLQADLVLDHYGEPRDYEAQISALHDPRGIHNGWVVLLHDITERKQAEEQLQHYQRQLEAQNLELRKLTLAIEQSGSTIVITDTDGAIEYANPRFEETTGYTIDEALGQNPRLLKSGEQSSDFYREMWETIASGQIWRGEFHNKRKDGSLYWEAATIAPVQGADGEVTNYIAIKDDITARKEAEAALQDYAEQLAVQNAELDAFAHTVAHDLKNPLTNVIGYADFMIQTHDAMPPDQLRNSLEFISRSGLKLDRIIESLLLLAGVRKKEVEPSPLAMAEIVQEACERLRLMIEESHAQISLPDPAVWPTVLGYAPWVEEVWANYISNALKYGGTPPHIELGYTILPASSIELPVSSIQFWVQDNGPGLTPEAQAELFTPFTRLGQVSMQGYGLGLSIVRRVVEKLGGQVGVESAPGQGSRFYFTLPLAPS